MLINEFISNVFEGVNASTDDLGISRRWIYNEARSIRAELIKQEFNKDRLYDGGQAQTLEDFKLEISEMATEPIMKSVNRLPNIIECDTGLTLDGIYTKSGRTIPLVNKQAWFNKKRRRFVRSSDIYAFIFGGYLYVDGFNDLEELRLDIPAYFDDPVSVGILSNIDDCGNIITSCKAAYDYDFYIPALIQRRVIEMVRSIVLRKLGIPTDVENNDKLDVSSQAQSSSQRLPQSTQEA